jgi:hypothetical protein
MIVLGADQRAVRPPQGGNRPTHQRTLDTSYRPARRLILGTYILDPTQAHGRVRTKAIGGIAGLKALPIRPWCFASVRSQRRSLQRLAPGGEIMWSMALPPQPPAPITFARAWIVAFANFPDFRSRLDSGNTRSACPKRCRSELWQRTGRAMAQGQLE